MAAAAMATTANTALAKSDGIAAARSLENVASSTTFLPRTTSTTNSSLHTTPPHSAEERMSSSLNTTPTSSLHSLPDTSFCSSTACSPAVAFNNNSSSSSSEILAQEKEKVLGVTILTQLQELDLAIKLREQNKVDGRKTRWIEHRKKQEELVKKSPDGASSNSAGTRRKNRSSGGGSRARHKKENRELSTTTPPTSADDASPTKTEDFVSLPGSPTNTDNNNTSIKRLLDPSNVTIPVVTTMKMEVTEPLVGCVEPTNVLETMKQQFLLDTTKENHLDSAKLTNGVLEDSNSTVKRPITESKKKNKSKSTADLSAKNSLMKKGPGVKPPKQKLKRITQAVNQKQGKKAKEIKTKKQIAAAVVATALKKIPSGGPLPKDISISNFFTKQKTRGLREVRKPEGEDDDATREDSCATASASQNDDVSKPAAAAPLLLPTAGQPFRCPLIAATAKIVTGKGNVKKKLLGKTSVKLTAAEKKTLRSVLNGGVRQVSRDSVTLSSNYKKRQAKLRDALGEKSHGVADSPHSLPQANSKQPSNALDSDSDSPDFLSKRGGKGRGFKRKLQRDVSLPSPPKKCTKKTSTVVAEVHNTMNGEPQSNVPANKAPGATRKKKQVPVADVVTSPTKSVIKAASATDVDTVSSTDNVTAHSSPVTANVVRDDLRTGDSPANANGNTHIKDTVDSSLCNGDSNQSINGSPTNSLLSSDTVAISSNKTPTKSGLTITRSNSSSLHSKTSPVIKRFSSSGDSSSKITIDSSLPTGDENSSTPTHSDTLPRSQSLSNGNNTKLVRKVSSPSKSSDQMLKSDSIVPEQPSPLRKRNATSPVKLIRPSSLKSKETPSKDVAIITENSSPNYKVIQTSNGDISNLSNDILPIVADNLTENIELIISPNRKTETQVASPSDNVKQNGLSRRSMKAQAMLIPEEPKQSSPKRKSATEIQSERLQPSPIVPDEVPAEIRTKSPTGSDCDNNNSSVLLVDDKHEPESTSVSNSAGNETTNQQTILSETNDTANEQPQEKSSKLKNSGPGDSEKRSGKMPRYLKQLFTDEGVQNMLKSIEGDSNMVGADGVTPITSDAMLHKLRPKRPPEHSMAISPEPELDVAFFPSTASGKRRKKYNEVDSLLMDEGLLNLLTSREGSSRRGIPIRDESQPEANTRKFDASTAASDSNNQGKACYVESVSTLLYANGEVTEVALSSDDKAVSDNNEVVMNKETALKRRPGRPQKLRQQNQSKSTYPPVTPDIEVLEQYDSVSKNNKTGAVDGSSSAVVVNHTSPAAITASLDNSIVRPDCVGKNSSNSLLLNAPNDTSTSPDARVGAASTTTTTTAKTGGGTAAACGGAIGARAPSNAGIDRQQQLTPQAPIKMRRMDLPTSPTMASLDSLVRCLEEGSGHQHSGDGASAVPTSSVAFMQHRVPGPAMPTLRGMRGLVMDNLGGGGGGGGLRQSQRSSVRHNAELSAAVNYRDIVLRKMNNFVHIIMAPQTTKIKNSLNSRVLRELCDALSTLRGDPSVRLVLLTSNGASWCQGVDLTSLHHHNPDTRHNHAHNLARAIKEFLKMLVQFPKPIIAGVNGNAMGLGVTMLPLFDMVFASDSAEFYLPYSKLGQVPEGGATYTFPTLLGKLQSTRLFMGHKFSAAEGMQLGLVSEVLWPSNFQETLLPKVALLATQSAQSMEATKALMNHHLLTKLELSVESECHTLLSQWTSTTFDVLSRRFLDTHAPLMQKPVVVPL